VPAIAAYDLSDGAPDTLDLLVDEDGPYSRLSEVTACPRPLVVVTFC